MQHAPCNMQHATATRNMRIQRTNCTGNQLATCGMRYATCDMRHVAATCNLAACNCNVILHACGARLAAYSMQRSMWMQDQTTTASNMKPAACIILLAHSGVCVWEGGDRQDGTGDMQQAARGMQRTRRVKHATCNSGACNIQQRGCNMRIQHATHTQTDTHRHTHTHARTQQSVRHATCNRQTACGMQHATDRQHAACNMQPTDSVRHATCNMQQTACGMQHATDRQRAACGMQQRARTTPGWQYTAESAQRAGGREPFRAPASGYTSGMGAGTAGLDELAGVCECAAIRRHGRCSTRISTTCNVKQDDTACNVQHDINNSQPVT